MLRPQSVVERHAAVVARIEAKPELWLEARDEEMAAYCGKSFRCDK